MKKVNPADILISPLGMENLLVIDQANDEVIKNNELLLDKPYFSLEEVLDGLNKDGHYLIIVEGPLHGEIYRYNNYGGQEALDRLCENDYFDEKGNCNCELIVMDRILLQELVDKTTWVPVKKGLPDDRQVVLTIKNKHISILEYHADTKHWFETRGNWWWSYNMVDAWMPLPKPYLGSER